MTADPARVAAARQLLAHLGATLADLQADPGPSLPTIAEYLPRVAAAAGPGARRTYGTYWSRMAAAWGDLPLDAVAASDIEAMQRQIAATAGSRRNSRSGRHAGEHVIAAARAVYNRAIADGLIDAAASPAHRVVKLRRLPSTRRALTPDELEQINLVARSSGNDVILDALLLRLHTETACRRGGALGLRLADLDTERGLVRLTEKGATLRWQPITLDLAAHLDEHARARGAVLPTDRLLRYRNGQAITSRRYDHLWKRIGQQLPWVAAQGISTHWLRHTTLTYEAALALSVRPDQEDLVAPVVKSLAEAYVFPGHAWPRLIYDGDLLVGFLMAFLNIPWDPDRNADDLRSGLWRLNIAAHAQGHGYGRFAVETVCEEIRASGGTRAYVTWEPRTGGPEGFYLKLGFRPTGEQSGGQTVGVLDLF